MADRHINQELQQELQQPSPYDIYLVTGSAQQRHGTSSEPWLSIPVAYDH